MDKKTKNEESVLKDATPNKSTTLTEEDISNSDVSVSEGKNSSDEGNETKPEKKSESLEYKLRRFKRQSSGIVAEVRKREAYVKPSVKRKKKSKEARRKNAKRFGSNR